MMSAVGGLGIAGHYCTVLYNSRLMLHATKRSLFTTGALEAGVATADAGDHSCNPYHWFPWPAV